MIGKSCESKERKTEEGVPPPLPYFSIILYDLLGLKPSPHETGLYSHL